MLHSQTTRKLSKYKAKSFRSSIYEKSGRIIYITVNSLKANVTTESPRQYPATLRSLMHLDYFVFCSIDTFEFSI